MGKPQSQLNERILNITLEIIFLLTGEDYGPVNENVIRSSAHHVSGGCSSTQKPITEPPIHSLIHEENHEHQILDLTKKIIELLTGEVLIRSQDVAVYFSMEEWEYIEEHKDLYRDIVFTSPDLSTATHELGERCTPVSSPFYLKNTNCLLATIQDVRCSSIGKQNMTNHWDTVAKKAISCEARCLRNSIIPPTGHIEQAPQINYGSLHTELSKEHKNAINYNHPELLDHTYAITARYKPLLLEERNPTDAGISAPTNHAQFKEEPNLYDDGSVTYTDLHTPMGPIQYTSVHIKEESMSCEGNTIDSITDHKQEYQFTHIKEEPTSCEVSYFTDSKCYTPTDPTQALFHIKAEPDSYDGECLENTAIRTPIYHMHQYTSHLQEQQPSEIDIYLPTDTQHAGGGKDVHKKHVQQHKSRDKPFLCTECGKRFLCKSGLSTHKKIHMFRKLHTCTECGKSFLSHSYLVRHQKIHSGEEANSCEDCGKCFLKASTLSVHQKVHTRKGPFSCTRCGKRFLRNSNLSRHQKIHGLEKPFACSECDKWFSSKSELVDHQRHHSGEKTFSCPTCGKSFIKIQNLLNHQRLHTGKNPFSCIECGKLFTSNTYLIRHMNLHTRKKTSYPCPTCGKYFNSNLDLTIHQRIHTEGKPGTSSEWRKCFIRKLGFVIHQRNHAKEKPFSCPICKERFVKKIHLFRHQKVHSDEKSLNA
ncbi:oocyte zinc finger protein XlCOF7.1-like isoform X1 [Bufo bufo]|uniref:oocyte zinc finger protein XlCOF7.1-like isoform X1 n=1 Tax=Bufo bufo TaxID=8384 RepID=UPI001ABDAC0D|nr:oocyte zinc finger protein XlCOF7.1-like isoform X1 [Bufo bufo]